MHFYSFFVKFFVTVTHMYVCNALCSMHYFSILKNFSALALKIIQWASEKIVVITHDFVRPTRETEKKT